MGLSHTELFQTVMVVPTQAPGRIGRSPWPPATSASCPCGDAAASTARGAIGADSVRSTLNNATAERSKNAPGQAQRFSHLKPLDGPL
jgi:hypothetical protein